LVLSRRRGRAGVITPPAAAVEAYASGTPATGLMPSTPRPGSVPAATSARPLPGTPNTGTRLSPLAGPPNSVRPSGSVKTGETVFGFAPAAIGRRLKPGEPGAKRGTPFAVVRTRPLVLSPGSVMPPPGTGMPPPLPPGSGTTIPPPPPDGGLTVPLPRPKPLPLRPPGLTLPLPLPRTGTVIDPPAPLWVRVPAALINP
jgi:hypothetical protein